MASNSDLQVGVSFDMNDVTKGVSKVGTTIKSGLSALGNVGSAALTGVKNLAVGVTAATAATTAAVTGLSAAVTSAINDVADYGDNIDKMSQKMGMSAETYQEWDSVMRHSGLTMETMQASMKTLANAAETGNEAFAALGITQEQIASMSQEELFEATIAGLQNVEDTTQRTYLAGKLLGRGATELGALLNMSAEETQAMRDRVHELGGVMSDEAVKASAKFKDSMQDLNTAFTGIKNRMVSELIPGATQVSDGLQEILIGNVEEGSALVQKGMTDIIDKLAEIGPKIIDIAKTVFKAFISSLPSILSKLQDVGGDIINTILSSISQNGPAISNFLFNMLRNAVTNLSNMITTLVPIIADTVTNFITYMIEFLQSQDFANIIETVKTTAMNIFTKAFELIVEYVPQLAQMAFNMLNTVITNATEMLRGSDFSNVVNTILDVIKSIVGFLMENLPELFSNLLNFVVELVSTLIRSIDLASIIASIGDIIGMIIDALPDFFDGILNAIFTLIDTIIDMIINTDWGAVFEQLITTLGTLFLKLGEALLEMAGNALGRIWEFITTTDWLALGQSIVDGIINGLAGFGDAIVDTLTSGITGGIEGLMDLLGIHSPSRVMFGIGQNITQGLINGLESKERGLISATDGISKILSDGMLLDTSLSASSLMAASYSGSTIQNTSITQTYTVGNLDVTNNKAATTAIDELCSALQIYSSQKPTFA